METITPQLIATLEGEDTARFVAFGVDFESSPIIAIATSPLDYRTTDPGAPSFPKTQGATPQGYKIYQAYEGEFHQTATVENEPFNIHFAQPLPDGRLLLACGRCVFHHREPQKNGRIYDANGRFLHGITLGDGIEDIQVDAEGRIWTSYFDEGVFGNYGWKRPLGESGLVAWTVNGENLYEFAPPSGVPHIADCYAMNVAKDGVWICYYTDFPLVQIRDGVVVGQWQVPISGAHAFAVQGTRVLFSGGYNEPNHYRLFELKDSGMTCLREFRLADESGNAIQAQRVIGARDGLYLLRDGEVHRLLIREVL